MTLYVPYFDFDADGVGFRSYAVCYFPVQTRICSRAPAIGAIWGFIVCICFDHADAGGSCDNACNRSALQGTFLGVVIMMGLYVVIGDTL